MTYRPALRAFAIALFTVAVRGVMRIPYLLESIPTLPIASISPAHQFSLRAVNAADKFILSAAALPSAPVPETKNGLVIGLDDQRDADRS
jgi:hypothetical protein